MVKILRIALLVFVMAQFSMHFENALAYDSHGKRDPFVPLVGLATRSVSGIADIMGIEDVSLQGIASDSLGRNAAVINGEMIREGETIGHVTIKKILKNDVILKINENEYLINIYEDKNSNKGG